MPQEADSTIHPGPLSTYIIFAGMLVRVGNVMDIAESSPVGLIIRRNQVGLGFNDDWWEVLVEGSIIKITGTSIWPIDDYHQGVLWK